MVSMKSKGGKTDKVGREYRYLFCSKRRREGMPDAIITSGYPIILLKKIYLMPFLKKLAL
jgi:hypothetical protein